MIIWLLLGIGIGTFIGALVVAFFSAGAYDKGHADGFQEGAEG